MISMLICISDEKESKFIVSYVRELAELESDERWDIRICRSGDDIFAAADEGESYDMILVDNSIPEAAAAVGKCRRINPEAHIIILSAKNQTAADCISAEYMNMGIIMRPFTQEKLENGLRDNVRSFVKRMNDGKTESSFILDSKDGRQFVPYNTISYFESREKKIFLYTHSNEYSFYDTLDRLEESLPQGKFIRCHRSFIVNRDKISGIAVSKNRLTLDNGEMIPISRTYKSELKELK